MGKFVVHERCGQQLLPSLRGTKKPKPGRKGLADVAIIAETHSDGGTVLDRSEFSGKLGADDAQHLRGCGRGQGDDDRVEFVGLQSGGNDPTRAFALNSLHGVRW